MGSTTRQTLGESGLSKVLVEDPTGQKWLVMPRDPGWPAVQANRTRPHIVLPLETILRGVSVHPDRVREHMEKLSVALKFTSDPDIADAFRRAVALYESCLTFLKFRETIGVEG